MLLYTMNERVRQYMNNNNLVVRDVVQKSYGCLIKLVCTVEGEDYNRILRLMVREPFTVTPNNFNFDGAFLKNLTVSSSGNIRGKNDYFVVASADFSDKNKKSTANIVCK